MAPRTGSTSEAEGFQGAVAGFSLSDVIQLNETNRFSGCVTVQHGERGGLIFFREGEVIHAEQGGKSGDEAFYDILAWRSGHFSLEPNMATTSHTIHKGSQHLLMEACRIMDERRAGQGQPPAQAAPSQPVSKIGAASLAEQLRAVSGVTCAVLMSKDGACVEDDSLEAEALAGRAAYVAMMANKLGALFRAGPVRAAAIHGAAGHEHVLLLAAKNQYYLSLRADGSAAVGSLEADVRKILGRGR